MVLAHTYDFDVSLAITFDYGQQAAAQEISHAKKTAQYLGVPHRAVKIESLRELKSGGALLAPNRRLPQPTLNQLSDGTFTMESAKAVWVPNRNGLFIETAAAIAEDMGADAIIVGFNKEEAETFPDNSSDYLAAITHALSFSTSNQVKVLSPTAGFTKTQIVETALEEGFPLKLLWSCYEGSPKMCGSCESCMRLKRALKINGVSSNDLFENACL